MASDSGSGDDLVAQVVASVERGVGYVRDNATQKVIVVVRALVFGLIAAMVGIMLITLLAVGLVRLLYQLPGNRPWVAHGIAGLVFVIAGAVMMRKRTARS